MSTTLHADATAPASRTLTSLAPNSAPLSLDQATVTVLLTTYNGRRYLPDQLDSIASQTHKRWFIVLSDDGSTDGTLDLAYRYQSRALCGRLAVRKGPGCGFINNFMSMVCDPFVASPVYAFCDQDDVWYPEKLERALRALSGIPEGTPAIYCGRTRYTDAYGHPVGYARVMRRPPSFGNALVQSIAGGNTMVFNEAARALLAKYAEHTPRTSHDWWSYMLVSGCGGVIVYDDQPTLDYRQHGNNIIGANTSLSGAVKRACMLFSGRFRTWNEANCEALDKVRELTLRARRQLANFEAAREARFPVARLRALRRSGVYRHTLRDNVALLLAATLKRI